MKYLSLFTGIGGFEVAIHKVFPDAECVGYSEVKPHAIKVYEHHFTGHKNLGDITKITDEQIREVVKDGCDMIFGGFPCTNLSSMANIRGDDTGLKGKKSSLFYEMIRVIRIVKPKYVIVENNFSMKKSNRGMITETLQNLFDEPIHMTMINAADFGIQARKRLYWTNFEIQDEIRVCEQEWEDVLEPIEKVEPYFLSNQMTLCLNKMLPRRKNTTRIAKQYENENAYYFEQVETNNEKSRWEVFPKSDTGKDKAQTFLGSSGGGNNVLIDRRHYDENVFYPRNFIPVEVERMFHYDDGYTDLGLSRTSRDNLLGNSVVVKVIEYIVETLKTRTSV